jgi:hypothetical protein
MATFHRLATGEWVAKGKVGELVPGEPVVIQERSGAVCQRTVERVTEARGSTALGYLAEHCQSASRAAHDRRITMENGGERVD